jgi:Berberine and berberine like
VTSLTFALPVAPPVVTRYTIKWSSLDDLVRVLGAWQHWASSAPRALTSKLNIYHGNFQAAGWFLGSTEDLAPLLWQLTRVATPASSSTQQGNYSEAILDYAGCSTWTQCAQQTSFRSLLKPTTWTNHSWYAKTAYALEPFSAETIARVATLMREPANALSQAQYLLLDAYGGAIADLPDAETAFPWRSALFHAQLLGYYNEESDALPTRRYLDAVYAAIYPAIALVPTSSTASSPCNSSTSCPTTFAKQRLVPPAYRNYCDPALQDYLASYYGSVERQQRLRSIKAAYDPHNLFRYAQSVPLPNTLAQQA